MKMGPKDLMVMVTALVCCMMYSNGKIALKTRKNELPTERRKIVKLLLRNFPLQESASYHNLVEDDEVGQPISNGNHMTQYAPAYPYQEESMSSNKANAFKYQERTTKLVKKTQPDLSKFKYALSTILLPPPIPSDLPSLPSSVLADENADEYMTHNDKYFPETEESIEHNADVYYAPYLQNMYPSSKSGNIQLMPSLSFEENADQYYAPYLQYEQPNIQNTADKYYLPYNQYAQQQQDDWLQYYRRKSDDSTYESLGELPQHSLDFLYKGPMEEHIDFENLPTLQAGNQFPGPSSIDNEIVDVPKVFLKIQ
jgi:hypothetical protein